MKCWLWLVPEMPSWSGDVPGPILRPIPQKLREASLGAWTLVVDGSLQDLGVAALTMRSSIEELEPSSLKP